jgi:phospholipid-binding lipoprotein MlaA
MNRVFYAINQPIDRFIFRPPAMVYKAVVPRPAREGVRNALSNIYSPVTFLNDVVQLRPKRALNTLGRFLINSTLGIGGLFDIAKRKPFHLQGHTNSFSNSLAMLGMTSGPYLYLPFIGPSSFRDMLGAGGDTFAQPLLVNRVYSRQERTVGNPLRPRKVSSFSSALSLSTFGVVLATLSALDRRAEADAELKALKASAVDPYVALREAYLQNREAEIAAIKAKDGQAAPVAAFDDPLADPAAPSTPDHPLPATPDQSPAKDQSSAKGSLRRAKGHALCDPFIFSACRRILRLLRSGFGRLAALVFQPGPEQQARAKAHIAQAQHQTERQRRRRVDAHRKARQHRACLLHAKASGHKEQDHAGRGRRALDGQRVEQGQRHAHHLGRQPHLHARQAPAHHMQRNRHRQAHALALQFAAHQMDLGSSAAAHTGLAPTGVMVAAPPQAPCQQQHRQSAQHPQRARSAMMRLPDRQALLRAAAMPPAPQHPARQRHIGDLGDHLGGDIEHAQRHRRTPPPAQQHDNARADRLAKAGGKISRLCPASRVRRAIRLARKGMPTFSAC